MNGRTYSEVLRAIAPHIAPHPHAVAILRTLAEAERDNTEDPDGWDTADAVYWHAVDWHAGQGCAWYAVLSALSRLRFEPGILARGPETLTARELAGALHAIELAGREVIGGTLRTSDLALRFLALLGALDSDAALAYTSTACGFAPIPSHAMEDPSAEFWHSEDAALILEALFEELEARAPDGYTFGAHPSDGASFGFWPSEER